MQFIFFALACLQCKGSPAGGFSSCSLSDESSESLESSSESLESSSESSESWDASVSLSWIFLQMSSNGSCVAASSFLTLSSASVVSLSSCRVSSAACSSSSSSRPTSVLLRPGYRKICLLPVLSYAIAYPKEYRVRIQILLVQKNRNYFKFMESNE
jgi:hypothetical protein